MLLKIFEKFVSKFSNFSAKQVSMFAVHDVNTSITQCVDFSAKKGDNCCSICCSKALIN